MELTLDGEAAADSGAGGAAGADGDLEVEGPGRSARVRVVRLDADTLVAELDGERERFVFVAAAGVLLIAHRGEVFRLTTGVGPAPATAGRGEVVMAPSPESWSASAWPPATGWTRAPCSGSWSR